MSKEDEITELTQCALKPHRLAHKTSSGRKLARQPVRLCVSPVMIESESANNADGHEFICEDSRSFANRASCKSKQGILNVVRLGIAALLHAKQPHEVEGALPHPLKVL